MNLSWLATATLLVGARAAAGEPCAPNAQLSGDGAAVERVGLELHRLGVTIGNAAPGCPSVEAAVQLDRDGIAVAVRDASHRSEGRVVGDATVAAVWIDSWLHDDLDPWRAPTPTPPPLAEAPALATRATVAPLATSWLDQLAVTAALEEAWQTDGSSWRGGSAAACVRIGGLCVGGRARYASQALTANLTAATRSDVSLLATAATTFRIGSMRVTPELGLGVGRIETTRVDSCPAVMPPICDPNDPTCSMMQPPPTCDVTNGTMPKGVYVGDNLQVSTYTPRAVLALRVAVPLVSRVWLEVLGSATAMPLAHTDAFGATTMVANVPPDQIALPGEPSITFQLGVGLRIEAP